MIEPPLRVQVLIAQSQAGLWRRNGYALLNQVQSTSGQYVHGICAFSTYIPVDVWSVCIYTLKHVMLKFMCLSVILLQFFSVHVSAQNFSCFELIKLRLVEYRHHHLFLYFQIYFYHNVKCRQEMYDKDILMLQVC